MSAVNKRILVYAILALIIISGLFLINPSFTGMLGLEKQNKIDSAVLSALDENSTADVIIILKEPDEIKGKFKTQGIEDRKQQIKQMQEEVLSALDYVNYSDRKEENKSKNKITGFFATEETDLELKHQYKTLNLLSGKISNGGLRKLESNPNVKYVEIEKSFDIGLNESAVQIKATDAHAINVSGNNITGKGQTVCVLDTGVDYNHTDLGGGWGNKVIAGYDFVNDDSDPMDDNSHGTHVAGIVASTNSVYMGVAPEAKIAAFKICPSSGTNCLVSDIISAIDECVANKTALNISVITMSVGGGNYTSNCDDANPSLALSVNAAVANGILVSASSGNNGYNDGISAPACLANVTSVGSVDKSDVIAASSNVGDILDILAPGVSITSTCLGGGMCVKSGTSMATPHVAGAAALIYQYEKELNGRNATPKQVRAILKKSSTIIYVARANLSFPRLNVLDSINSILQLNATSNTIKDRLGNAEIKFNSSFGLENSSEAFTIRNNFIGVDTAKYPEFLGKGANLTLYNLSFEKTPVIYKNGIWCNETCSIIIYDSKNLSFSVAGFSNYTAGANSQLEIFDDVDLGITRRTYQDVYFYANYTNVTSGAPISTGICNISFSDGVNGSMVYSNGLFNYTRAFNIADLYTYNVSCNDTDYESLNTTDDITILPSCINSTGQEVSQPLPNNDWIITNDNVTCSNANIYFQNQTLIVGANVTFVLNGSSLILNQSVTNMEIVINETSNIVIYNSIIRSKTANKFNLKIFSNSNIYNLTTNKSDIKFIANNNSVLDCKFNDYVYLAGSSSNTVNNSIFNSYAYLTDNSTNNIENAIFNNYIYLQSNSSNNFKNCSFYSRFYFDDISNTNFTLPGSNLSQTQVYFYLDSPTIYGYVDMPDRKSVV